MRILVSLVVASMLFFVTDFVYAGSKDITIERSYDKLNLKIGITYPENWEIEENNENILLSLIYENNYAQNKYNQDSSVVSISIFAEKFKIDKENDSNYYNKLLESTYDDIQKYINKEINEINIMFKVFKTIEKVYFSEISNFKFIVIDATFESDEHSNIELINPKLYIAFINNLKFMISSNIAFDKKLNIFERKLICNKFLIEREKIINSIKIVTIN